MTGYSFPVTVNILSFTGKVYCDTRCSFLFLSQEINFLSQEILFISQEKILLWQILLLSQEVYFLSQEVFLWHGYISSCDRKCSSYYKEYSFLVKFGSSYLCIPFSRQMCGIYNQNFLWDIRISWEPGSLVPWDYPTLCICYIYVIIMLC